MNTFKNIMRFIFTFAAIVYMHVAIVVPTMSHWGNFQEIARLNTFWSTFSYNFVKIN